MDQFSYFLSCDWGTTSFRLRLVERGSGCVLDAIRTADGVVRMAETAGEGGRAKHFASFLAAQAETLIARNEVCGTEPLPCVVSGMASSRLGWEELPYAPLPQPPDGSGLVGKALDLPLQGRAPLKVWLVSGVRGEADVLRGEEMEWLGLVWRIPSFAEAESASLILPGTHSKHLRLERGALVDFHTVMTGELFATLSQSPTLRGCLRPGAEFGPDAAAFLRGVRAAAVPGFVQALFQIRARHLLDGIPLEDGTAALSGLLIGAELHPLPAAPRARMAVAGRLGPYYQSAARELGLREIEVIPGDWLDEALAWGHRQWLDAREG